MSDQQPNTRTAADFRDEDIVDVKGAAIVTGLSVSTLCKLRLTGGGPIYLKLGSSPAAAVRYRVGDARRWLAQHIRTSTSEVA